MKSCTINKISKIIDSVIEYIIATLLILGTRSIYIHQRNFYSTKYLLLIELLITFLLIYFIKVVIFENDFNNIILKGKKFLKKYFKYAVVYYVFILFYMSYHNINDAIYERTFFIMFPLLIFVYLTTKNKALEIVKKICNVMILLSLISLFCYFTINIFKILEYNGYYAVSWGPRIISNSFYNIYFERQRINIFGLNLVRNTGIFTEAPMHSLNLVIALAMEKFILNRNKKWMNLIYIATILTTFSTTGLIAISLIYILIIFDKIKNNNKISKKMKIGMLCLIAIFIAISVAAFIDKLGTSSGSTRVDDYKAAYHAWQDSPMMGGGYAKSYKIKKYMSEWRMDNTGLSNSLMVLLAEGGIFIFTIYIVPLINIIMDAFSKKKYNLLYFGVIILMLFATTIFHYTTMMMNILALGYFFILKNEEFLDGDVKSNK